MATTKKGGTDKGGNKFPDKLERHPLSEKYGPKMADDELAGLGKDIKAHGQHEDIIMFEGKVLAGWNRYMACLQQGVKPRFKQFEQLQKEGAEGSAVTPVAVAFGTNFMRRRLSSVQKALYGAQYALDTGAKQTEVAKMMGCNLNRLNQCCQLIKSAESGADAAREALDWLRDNPELTGGAFDEKMLEIGITRPTAPPPPARTNTHADDGDDDGLGDLDGVDDLTGGAIDDILDGAGGDEESPEPSRRKPREIGDGSEPLPAVGSKPTKLTNPHETPVSRVAKAFKALPAEEQAKFVKFAWAKLKVALDTAISTGEVDYTAPEPGSKPEPKAKGRVKGGKAAVEAVAKSGKPDPSIIARGKPPAVEDDDMLAGKAADKVDRKKDPKPAPAKKAPAKKAPAKKAPAKKAPAKKAAK